MTLLSAIVPDSGAGGTYTSNIFDAGGIVGWQEIAWTGNSGELPAGAQTDETVDMTGNVLLYHLNNDSELR